MSCHSIDGQTVCFQKTSVDRTLQLRHSVLWPSMPLSHVILPEDESGTHIGAFFPGQTDPIAVISLFLENCPIDKEEIVLNNTHEQAVRFRKFACSPQYQGKGLGTQLLRYALSIAQSEQGATIAWCDARTDSAEWYRKRGLYPFGDTFFKGPVEYVRMRIDLRDLGKPEQDPEVLHA
ncbi:hypothetical protein CPB84DRAFT_1817533 [Gymnopilus junonius]|uniref:N-acetyltransferase domain-containing protein n=1 Tax=Gymnopilus junonius TaxID=109634 RepID=A0A9P5THG4_GYMJU|nr:hypothetical protein CPB84DRAFT_1817533 [Gymnopilus junonius]